MKKEVWKDINGYDGYYQVSNIGNVRSLERTVGIDFTNMNNTLTGIGNFRVKGKILKPSGNRYLKVGLRKNGVTTFYTVHRLVASAFIPNTENKACVNHKSGDKTNNDVDNLEWSSYAENINHARYTLKVKTKLGFRKNKTI
jgi:hypothetical protein